MNKIACTKCGFKLKGTENYCPVCGLNLKERTAQEVPVQEQLLCLKTDNKTFSSYLFFDDSRA